MFKTIEVLCKTIENMNIRRRILLISFFSSKLGNNVDWIHSFRAMFHIDITNRLVSISRKSKMDSGIDIVCASLESISGTYRQLRARRARYHFSKLFRWEPEGRYRDSKLLRWEPEGRYHYSKLFRWEPEGRYRDWQRKRPFGSQRHI